MADTFKRPGRFDGWNLRSEHFGAVIDAEGRTVAISETVRQGRDIVALSHILRDVVGELIFGEGTDDSLQRALDAANRHLKALGLDRDSAPLPAHIKR